MLSMLVDGFHDDAPPLSHAETWSHMARKQTRGTRSRQEDRNRDGSTWADTVEDTGAQATTHTNTDAADTDTGADIDTTAGAETGEDTDTDAVANPPQTRHTGPCDRCVLCQQDTTADNSTGHPSAWDETLELVKCVCCCVQTPHQQFRRGCRVYPSLEADPDHGTWVLIEPNVCACLKREYPSPCHNFNTSHLGHGESTAASSASIASRFFIAFLPKKSITFKRELLLLNWFQKRPKRTKSTASLLSSLFPPLPPLLGSDHWWPAWDLRTAMARSRDKRHINHHELDRPCDGPCTLSAKGLSSHSPSRPPRCIAFGDYSGSSVALFHRFASLSLLSARSRRGQQDRWHSVGLLGMERSDGGLWDVTISMLSAQVRRAHHRVRELNTSFDNIVSSAPVVEQHVQDEGLQVRYITNKTTSFRPVLLRTASTLC